MPSYTALGEDQLTATTIPFQDWFAPSDVDTVAHRMGNLIGKNHSDLSLLNPFGAWYRIVGMDSNNVKTWLERFAMTARTRGDELTYATRESYRQDLMGKYGYSSEDLDEYFGAYFQLKDANLLPESLRNPSGYTPRQSSLPSAIGTVLGQTVQGATRSMWPQLLLAGGIIVAAYAFFGKGIPRLIEKKI